MINLSWPLLLTVSWVETELVPTEPNEVEPLSRSSSLLLVFLFSARCMLACVAGGRWRAKAKDSRSSAARDSGFAAYEFCLRAPTRPPATQARCMYAKWGATPKEVLIFALNCRDLTMWGASRSVFHLALVKGAPRGGGCKGERPWLYIDVVASPAISLVYMRTH